jgi:uncharacterized protein YndB with AHSA1/START domain
MTARKTVHDTFTLERRYKASPARVFAAWSDPKEKAKWFHGPNEKGRDPLALDFRVGGREHASGVAQDGTRHTYDALYLDIVPNERFILTYWMSIDDVPISASLQTVELFADGSGTRLKFTEQDAFLDGWDDAGSRREGTEQLLKQLAEALGG